MLQYTLSTLPSFAAFFAVAVLVLAVFVTAFMWVTPYRELALVREGNVAAAVSLSGTLVSLSLPRYLRELGRLEAGSRIIPALAFVAMLLALAGNLYPVPEGPYGKLPYIYLVYLAAGMAWFFIGTRQARAVEAQPET